MPQILDARFQTGNPQQLTNASIIFRHVRWSGQQGTPDPYWNSGWRKFSQRGRIGGSLSYEGGFGTKLAFDHCIWDHNGNNFMAGPVISVVGRAEDSYDESVRLTMGSTVNGQPLQGWEVDKGAKGG